MARKKTTARAVPIQFPATWKGPQAPTGPSTTCNACQTKNLYWGWDPRKSKPMLVEVSHGHRYMHNCPTPQTDDIFPGWCDTCKAPELLWLRTNKGFELSETYGLPHTCEQDPMKAIQEISKARCRLCKTNGLFWVKVQSKWTLSDSNGVRHDCGLYPVYSKEWAEAKRLNYAFEKKWLKSIPDGTPCKRCKGRSRVRYFSKAKAILAKYNTTEPVEMIRPCLHCKRIGTFSAENKKSYLKDMRKKYWPFRGGVHKWKQYDTNNGT